jgi:GNAT superfamily N-acetyltransferase
MVPSEPELTANFVGAIKAFAECAGGKVKETSGVICIKTPLKPAFFNTTFLNAHTTLSKNLLEKIKAFYRDRKEEWCFTVSPGAEPLLETIIEHAKVSGRNTTAEMVVSKENVRFREQPPDLEIEVVSNLKSLGTWLRVSEKGWGIEPGSLRLHVTKKTLEFPGATYFLGLNNGKPVSTSMSFISDKIVGIYNVSTIPEARGKGFGEALTAAAIKHGFENGCTISSLQASPKGFPVYFRMGFRRVYDYEIWIIKNT